MPELPEVETTVRGLQKEVIGLQITDVWTDLDTKDKRKSDTVANPKFFKLFKKEIIGRKIVKAERRAKNILIHLSGGKTILIHLKMTGYLFYGKDPKIKYAHVIFSLSNKTSPRPSPYKGEGVRYLVFSDLRKFGKMTLLNTEQVPESKHLKDLGPEPLARDFTLEKFKQRILKKPNGKIKTVLMNQALVVGIGNIYSDEILWRAEIHPERKVQNIKIAEYEKMWKAIKETLKKGIDFGGDSMSDYKNIYGLNGAFQLHHEAYRRTGELCRHKKCQNKKSVIIRKMVNNRSAHFCSKHQI